MGRNRTLPCLVLMTVPWRWFRRPPVILETHVREFPSRTMSLAACIFVCRCLIDILALQHPQTLVSRESLVARSLALTTMYSIAAFSFGALGDFVALFDLAQKVKRSLNASSGGSEDYLTLLVEIDSLIRILRTATTASTSTRLPQLTPHLVRTGRHALKSLQDVLKSIETKIRTYQDNLRKGGSLRMMMDSWRKIGWGLLVMNDEVKTLRWQLSYHIIILQAVISFAQW